jgi:hypothetical protein
MSNLTFKEIDDHIDEMLSQGKSEDEIIAWIESQPNAKEYTADNTETVDAMLITPKEALLPPE